MLNALIQTRSNHKHLRLTLRAPSIHTKSIYTGIAYYQPRRSRAMGDALVDDPPPPQQQALSTTSATERLYLTDTHCFALSGGVHVLAVVSETDSKTGTARTAVVLDRTIFHPQGGGQPADQGTIVLLHRKDGSGLESSVVSFTVESVRDDGTGALKHYGSYVGDVVEGFRPGDEVALEIDEARRRLHARLHSAGHALDVAMARIGLGGECLKPTKGYHFADGSYVEYAGELPAAYAADTEALAAALNAEMARLVEEGADTKVHVLSKAEAGELLPGGPEELAHLPDDRDVRVVAVAGGPCPCGGTHVRSTTELGRVEVTRIKVTAKKKLVKVSYKIEPAAVEQES